MCFGKKPKATLVSNPGMGYTRQEPDDLANAFESLSIHDRPVRPVPRPTYPPSPLSSNQNLPVPHGPPPARIPYQATTSYYAPSPLSTQPSTISQYYPSPPPTVPQPTTSYRLTSPPPTAPASQGTISPSEYYRSQHLNSSTTSYASSSPPPTINSSPSPYPAAPTPPIAPLPYKPFPQAPNRNSSNIPRFPLTPTPRCPNRNCNWTPKIRSECPATNPNGNAYRPYYICIKCKKAPSPPTPARKTRQGHSKGWITWDDAIGIHPDNPRCDCPGGWVARQDRGGENGFYQGGGFWTCATGRCAYLSFRLDGDPVMEGRWDDGFEPWLLPPVPQ